MEQSRKQLLIGGILIVVIIILFLLVKAVPAESLKAFVESAAASMPLPLFTFIIALIDGFNPCNLFILTLLLTLLISASHSKARIYTIGYAFVAVVYVFYFLFMTLWLNVFKYIGFIDPLRIAIAVLALVAGLINVKELFFFRKGITLMIQEKQKGPLVKKIENMKNVIVKGSMPALIVASVSLAIFSSLVELPCTAGFPIIYTGILTGKYLASSASYYLYLLLYNLVYVLPLIVIIGVIGLTLKSKQISKDAMAWIKFIGGLIMILLGIILLAAPKLIGVG